MYSLDLKEIHALTNRIIMEQSFKKEERLCSKVVIDKLFADGLSFMASPIRIVWIKTACRSDFPIKVLIVVPKKNISSAVKRNKIKRQLRECYRKNKKLLYEGLETSKSSIALALIYTKNDLVLYQELERKIILTLHRLVERNEEDNK